MKRHFGELKDEWAIKPRVRVMRSTEARRSWIVYSLLILYFAALVLRLPVLDWGGGEPDEYPAGAAKVLAGQLSSDQQYYPPLLNYLTALAFAIYYVLGRVLGWWHSTTEFRAAYFGDVKQFYVLGRLVVAALSAAAAPLTFLLALDLGIRIRVALLLSAVMVFMPAAVFWSEIAKSDNGLGPSFLLILLAAFRLYEDPSRVDRQIGLGVAAAIALSLKQSTVFFLVPTLFILFAVGIFSQQKKQVLVGAWLVTGIAAVLTWIPLNIGILLNLRGFVDDQIALSQMNFRGGGVYESLTTWFENVTSESSGVSRAILGIWLFTPLICVLAVPESRSRFRLLTMWASVMIAMIIIIDMARQTVQLVLPYSVVITSTVLLLVGHFIDAPARAVRFSAGVVLAVIAGLSSVETVFIIQQARAEPAAKAVAAAVARYAPPGTRLLTDVDLRPYLPVSSVGEAETRARNERLAAKYSVVLPPVAEERLKPAEGYIIRMYPFVFGGLENVRGDDMKVVTPFAWPLQPDEWQLGYWTARDYRMFVFGASMLHDPLGAYRDFFSSIAQNCVLLDKVPATRQLVFENVMGHPEETWLVYRCS
jgi:4-amino-4-deoxy-L-arabinose transferase-like glycosyltransferase